MTIRHKDLTTAPPPAFAISLAQISAATFACGPLMAGAAIALGRFTPIVMLDVCGCWTLAVALLACHHLSQRAPASGPHPLRNLACLLGFGAVSLAVAVSYNVQVAGPAAQAGTLTGSARSDPGAGSQHSQGMTNITIHCENTQGAGRPRGRR